MITILSYGSGNVAAIESIYHRLGIPIQIASRPEQLRNATKLILPGVGAYDSAMELLECSSMLKEVDKLVREFKCPVLGVCVGMQIMGRSSEEGNRSGLGWIEADVRRLDVSRLHHKPMLPHMGWNSISPTRSDPIFNGVDFNKGFYFLHSFFMECESQCDVLACASYGASFTCAVRKDNIFGFQFHPEKSHRNGEAIFKNFADL